MEPHSYASPALQNPAFQMVTHGRLRWFQKRWEIELHIEAETQGRRDVLFDLDRLWYGFVPAGDLEILVGRIHPYEMSRHPARHHSWGLLSTRQSQNRGLLLGSGMRASGLSPDPTLLGWAGAHASWERPGKVGASLSLSPLFVPPLGPEVVLSPGAPAYWGRFARRIPERVVIDGKVYPVQLQVDRSRLWQDVLFQPQAMGQVWWSYGGGVSGWVTLGRAPSPEGSFPNESYLRIHENGVSAHALVRPRFLQRWESSLTHQWDLTDSLRVWGSALAASDRSHGAEVGTELGPLSLSLLHEWAQEPASDSYRDLMGQLDFNQRVLGIESYLGLKRHFRQNDLWARVGARVSFSKETKLDLGVDLFSGSDGSYFGEWRANDRVFTALTWELGS